MLAIRYSWKQRLVQVVCALSTAILFNTTVLAQGKGGKEEPVNKDISFTARVSPVAEPTSLVIALRDIPEDIALEYSDVDDGFKPFVVTINKTLSSATRVTIVENDGLKSGADGNILMPYLKVGDSGEQLTTKNATANFSEKGGASATLEFGVKTQKNERPEVGDYEGKIVLLFEDAS